MPFFSFSSIPGSQQGADQDTGARARVPALDARGQLRHTVIHIRPNKVTLYCVFIRLEFRGVVEEKSTRFTCHV